MRPTHRLGQLLVLLTLCSTYTASAEDIDLFLRNEAVAGVRPNVLLVLDNAASNNSTITMLDGVSTGNKLDMLRDVLVNILDPDNSAYFTACTIVGTTRTPEGCVTTAEVKTLLESINLGLMINNPSGTDAGGYVRYHVRPMNVAANRQSLLAEITPSIPQSNNAPYAKSMHEAYRYFAGRTDYVGFKSNEYDPEAELGDDVYRSPITESCQDNYLLFIGNGGPDSGEVRETGTLLSRLGGVLRTDPIQFSPSNYTSSWFDEYARTMKRQDLVTSMDGIQNVTTYTIAVQNPEDRNYATTDMQSARKLLESAAAVGGGEYYEAHNGQQALRAFIDMLRKFQAVDSVFAASTLPVSVNVRGTYLNQVYMGQFRPEENAEPRWPGNLKQYRIALNASGQPVLADRFGEAVEDTNKGFILPDKTSFWTVDSTYWSFFPIGNPPSASDAPDGNVVEKGGAAQRLRQDFATSQASRQLYTCVGSCVVGEALSTHRFEDSNTGITAAELSAIDATERTYIINWVRGEDQDDENVNELFTDIRPRIHGDLLHSRPAVVNYNRDGSDRDIVVYYGTNQGIFHAVKGGQDDSDGGEKWGMVFPEFFGQLKRLRENTPVISPSDPKPYFADGPVSAFQHDADDDGSYVAADGDKVYLYVGMRRGGRFAYALDVSDPDNPKHLWKIDNSGDFAELGQTWSTLRPARIRAVANDPVVIFGAGYDPEAEDPDPVNPGTNTKGRGIFVVNGRTGARVAHIMPPGMAAVPADVAVLDRDEDGLYDRIYAADTRGNVWRIDIDDADPANWQATKLAALGGTGAAARKFLNKPDVVFGADYDTILLGSGDREHPFDTTVENRFYMLKDTNIGLSGGYICSTQEADLSVVPRTCVESDLEDVTLNPYQDSTTIALQKNGWYLTLGPGEKVVGNAMTVFGTTYFGTNRPVASDGVCDSNLGEAKMYAVGYAGGTATTDTNADGVIDSGDRAEIIAGGGFPPSPVYARVEVDGKTVDAVCTGSHCTSPGGVTTTTKRFRTYWHIEQ